MTGPLGVVAGAGAVYASRPVDSDDPAVGADHKRRLAGVRDERVQPEA